MSLDVRIANNNANIKNNLKNISEMKVHLYISGSKCLSLLKGTPPLLKMPWPIAGWCVYLTHSCRF